MASSTQVSAEEVSWVWSRGLAGQQLGLDTKRHQHTFEKARPITDFYSIDKHEVGHGAYGICVPGCHLETKTSCVVKIVSKLKAGEEYMRNFEERGRNMFSILLGAAAEGHSNVVKYVDFLIGANLVFIVMEPLRGPELFEYMAEMEVFPESFCRNVMQQVFASLSCCHKWGIIHRDVKLENFRFRHADDRHHGLALVDFGLCCPVHPHEKRDIVGTLLYTAPEVFSGDYSTPIDIWAAGVMLYVMLTGSFPFSQESYEGTDKPIFSVDHVFAALDKLESHHVSEEAIDLLNSMLVLTPQNRISANDALVHSWFTSDLSSPSCTCTPEGKCSHASDSNARLGSPRSYMAARTMSVEAPQFHRNKNILRQLSDIERIAPQGIARTNGYQCAALAGTLASQSAPCNIIFLDVDGVLAPCVNAGQIVHQCVHLVTTLSKIATARIVLTSSWRLIAGKVDLLNKLFKSFHDADAIYDVSPDLFSQELSEEDIEQFDAKRFIRVSDKAGFSLDNALAALQVLGVSDEKSKQALREVPPDPDFDLHVFAEDRFQYEDACFSPRSRRAADYVREGCSVQFATTRCREIMAWLHFASKAGVCVRNFVVLDDDNLLQRDSSPLAKFERKRTGNFMTGVVAEPTTTKHDAPSIVSSEAASTDSVQTAAPESVANSVEDDDDDPWAMAF